MTALILTDEKEETKMTDRKKKIIYFLAGALSMLLVEVLLVAGFFVYLNYQSKMTEEQKNSLSVIEKLKGAPQQDNFTLDIPNVEPEIYDDRHLDNEEGSEGEDEEDDSLEMIKKLKNPPSQTQPQNLPKVEPEIYNDRDPKGREGNSEEQ